MKKTLFFAAIAVALASCGNQESQTDTETTVNAETPVATDGTDNTTPVSATKTYTAEDGDVMIKDGKLLEYKNGNWVVAEKDITLADGTVVSLKGDVKNKDGKMISIKDGETVKKTGEFFDKAGNAVSNAWDATKEGVKDAADATKEGLKNAADATKEGVKDAANAVKEKAEDAGKAVKEGASKAGEKAKELGEKAKKAVE